MKGNKDLDEWMMERYALAKTRVGEIPEEQEAAQPYLDFFQKTAGFLLKTIQVMEKTGGAVPGRTADRKQSVI